MTDTPSTDAQVEAVARRSCELMGLDPDRWHPYYGKDEWELYADPIRQHIAMARAVREVMGAT